MIETTKEMFAEYYDNAPNKCELENIKKKIISDYKYKTNPEIIYYQKNDIELNDSDIIFPETESK